MHKSNKPSLKKDQRNYSSIRSIYWSVDPLLGASSVAPPPAYIAIAVNPATLNSNPISVIIFGARLDGNFDATDLQKG